MHTNPRWRLSVVVGTRPEAIKLAPVILCLKQDPRFDCRVCASAQHRQMLDQVLETFDIPADTDLDLMLPNQTLGSLTARAIEALDNYLAKDHPDLVLIQGDTTTVFCATLAAFYHQIPVGHVEAGLRTWDLQSPWPEEANRVLTTRLASLHFAPTEAARRNLEREGVPRSMIEVTGNTVVDALLLALDRVRLAPPVIEGLDRGLVMSEARPRIVLITGHRRESFGGGFESICLAIRSLAEAFPEVHFVYPVHLNPNVREPVMRILGPFAKGSGQNVHLLEPLPYLSFVALLSASTIVLTDSGGIQEEAPSLGKPVLVMRDSTERPEAIEAGSVMLVGPHCDRIVSGVSRLLTDSAAYRQMAQPRNVYGDGKASRRIVEACANYLTNR